MNIGAESFFNRPSTPKPALQDGILGTVQRALSCDNAMLAFQPVVQSDQPDRAAFYEGLIRIVDDSGRFIPLRSFMPAAENTAIGRQIDCTTLDLGLQALMQEPSLRLSVNMSAQTIGCPQWARILHQGIAQDPLIAERLILEITESSAMIAPATVRSFMDELQDHGISFALDDFGAGYTSFRYLRDFNFDMIKIDGQFIHGIATHPDNQILTRALQSIAHHFDMFTVAESVENADDARWLTNMGIDCLQGYHFGAPTLLPPWKTPSPATHRG